MVAPGEIVGDRYRIDAPLPREAHGDVFRVHDMVVGHDAVLKMLPTGNVDFRWFDREVRLLARVDHPNVGRLIDAGRHGSAPYVVLDLVDGATLAERLRHGPLALSEARHVAYDIASALAHIHARGLAHGDVTPSSILFVADHRVMLADPGVARLLGGVRPTDPRSTAGSSRQAQSGGHEHVGAADIHALGLVLLASLSSRTAGTDDPDAGSAADQVVRESDLPPRFPVAWRPLVLSMLAPDPADRPAAGAVMAKLAGESTSGPEAPSAETQVLSADAVRRGVSRSPGHRGETPPDADRAANGPMRQPVMWALVAIATLAALAAIVIGRELSQGSSTVSPTDADTAAAVQDGNTTTLPPATTVPTTTVPPTTAPTTAPATTAPPAPTPTCADIDARKELLEDEKKQLDVVYSDDKDLREQVKSQIEDEKQGLDALKQTLGC